MAEQEATFRGIKVKLLQQIYAILLGVPKTENLLGHSCKKNGFPKGRGLRVRPPTINKALSKVNGLLPKGGDDDF